MSCSCKLRPARVRYYHYHNIINMIITIDYTITCITTIITISILLTINLLVLQSSPGATSQSPFSADHSPPRLKQAACRRSAEVYACLRIARNEWFAACQLRFCFATLGVCVGLGLDLGLDLGLGLSLSPSACLSGTH